MTQPTPPKRKPRAYGGMSAEERQRQRRDRFIEAGIEVFGRKGVSKATVRELCAEAGFTDRYYYELFADIENLFASTFEAITVELLASLHSAIQPADGPIVELARSGLLAFYGFLKEDPRRARILLVEAQIFYYSGELHSTINDDPYIAILAPALARRFPGIDAMELDVVYTIKTLLGMVISSAAIWYLDGMSKDVSETVENQLFVWRGLDDWLRSLTAEPARGRAPKVIKATSRRTS